MQSNFFRDLVILGLIVVAVFFFVGLAIYMVDQLVLAG